MPEFFLKIPVGLDHHQRIDEQEPDTFQILRRIRHEQQVEVELDQRNAEGNKEVGLFPRKYRARVLPGHEAEIDDVARFKRVAYGFEDIVEELCLRLEHFLLLRLVGKDQNFVF